MLKTNKMKEGTCFICGKPCLEGLYAHFECAFAYHQHKETETKEKGRLEREGRKVNWKKTIPKPDPLNL